MKIVGTEKLRKFCLKHADAEAALDRWADIVESADWQNHNDLKRDFPSADYVGNDRYVFNIKGNNYRLVVAVVFFAGRLFVRFVGTHSEYDRIKDIKSI